MNLRPLTLLAAVIIILSACGRDASGAQSTTTTTTPATAPSTTTTHEPVVSVHVKATVLASCDDAETDGSGFDDVAGSSMQIKSGAGTVIGYVNLPPRGTTENADVCTYTADAEDLPLVDIYQVGNDRRGFVTFSKADLQQASRVSWRYGLHANLTLG